jgi:hypothetical protein
MNATIRKIAIILLGGVLVAGSAVAAEARPRANDSRSWSRQSQLQSTWFQSRSDRRPLKIHWYSPS